MLNMQQVSDAIFTREDSVSFGKYRDYILRPAYQPIYGFDDRSSEVLKLVGFEGLIRPYRNNNLISPQDFFDRVKPEDRLFVECLSMAVHIRSYKTVTPSDRLLFININAANYPSNFALEAVVYYMFSQLAEHGLDNGRAVFEILETEVIDNTVLRRICDLFRSNGYRFALDDFGTKFSNVERYLSCRPDIVKLDRVLFRDFATVPSTARLLNSLVSAFVDNDASVLMEGLETPEEISMAAELDVDLMQGFQLGYPQILPGGFKPNLEINVHRPSLIGYDNSLLAM